MTKDSNPQPRSSCALANSLDLLGDRWSLLIIRDLLLTDRREFGHFLTAGEDISTNILSDRLERLQRAGIINKRKHPQHGKKFVYDLTLAGVKLAPVIIEMAKWSLENIPDTMIPDEIIRKVRDDREGLMAMIERREPLIRLYS